MKLTDEQFVKFWITAQNEGKNASWVAELSGLKPQSVHVRASNLRKKGVKLPTLLKGRPEKVVDVDKLNAIIKSESKAL